MPPVIGPSFESEIIAAGLLGKPFSWGEDGVFIMEGMTPEDEALLQSVIDAHNPAAPAPPVDPLSTPTTVEDLQKACETAFLSLGVTPVDFQAMISNAKQNRS